MASHIVITQGKSAFLHINYVPSQHLALKNNDKESQIPSVASKREHETKKHVLIGCQT